MWQKRERKAALKRSKSTPHVLEVELVFCSVNLSGSPEALVYAKIINGNCDAHRSTFSGVEPALVYSGQLARNSEPVLILSMTTK